MEENEVYLAAQEILEGILDFIFPNLDGEYVLTDEDELLRKDMMIDEDIFMEDNEDKTLQKDKRNYLRSQEKKIEDSKKFLKDHQSQEKNIEEDGNFLKNLKSQEKIEVEYLFLMDLKSQERKIEEFKNFPQNHKSLEKKIELHDMCLRDLKSQERKIEEDKNFLKNHKSQEKKIEVDDTTQKNLKSQKKVEGDEDEDIKNRVEGNEDEDIKKRVEGNEDEEIKKRVESNEDEEILESSEFVEDGTGKVSETIKVFEYAKEHDSGENLQSVKNRDSLDELDEGIYTVVCIFSSNLDLLFFNLDFWSFEKWDWNSNDAQVFLSL